MKIYMYWFYRRLSHKSWNKKVDKNVWFETKLEMLEALSLFLRVSLSLLTPTVNLFLHLNVDPQSFCNLYINLACLFVCLFVCLYPINVKTAEPIGPKFCVGHHVTTGKVYESSKFQIFVSIKIRSSLNF